MDMALYKSYVLLLLLLFQKVSGDEINLDNNKKTNKEEQKKISISLTAAKSADWITSNPQDETVKGKNSGKTLTT